MTDRTGYPNVVVDIERVRASGLVKDEIGLDQPDEKGTFSTTLLREAVQGHADRSSSAGRPTRRPRASRRCCRCWSSRCRTRRARPSSTEMVSVIEAEWPDLGPDAIAHVLGEHEPIVLGSRTVDWVYPRVDPDRHRHPRRPGQGGDLDRLGLPARRGPLLRAAGEGRHPHRPDHRPHGPPAARAPDRHRRRRSTR